MAANVRLIEIRKRCGDILAAAGDVFDSKEEYNSLCEEFISLGGSKDDTIVRVAERLLGFYTKGGENDRSGQGPWERYST